MSKQNKSSEMNQRIPKGYKNSPLGIIPEEWSIEELNIISDIYDGTHSTPKYVDEGIPFYSVEQVMSNNFNDTKFISPLVFEKENKRVKIEKGDILMTRIGDVGTAKFIDWDVQASFYVSLALIKNRSEHNFNYLNHYIASKGFKLELNKRTIHVAFPIKINLGEIGYCKVLLPPKIEQNSIANCLTTWDIAVQTIGLLIKQKEQRKKWLMQHLLSGKKRLKGFEKEKWKKYCYADILKVVKKPVLWNDSELYRLISVRRRSGGIFEREALYGNQILVKDLRTANTGDFLFSKMQIVHGASSLVTNEFDGTKISGSYIATVAKDPKTLNMDYFNWYSKLPYFYHQTYVSSYGVHIEKMTFDWESFTGLGIKLPSVEEQKEIVKVLQTADLEIQLLRNKLDLLKDQKKGLMQQLLTGKKRLKLT